MPDQPPLLAYPDPPLTDGVVVLRRWAQDDLSCVEEATQDPDIPKGTTVPATFTPKAELEAKGVAFEGAPRDLRFGVGVPMMLVNVRYMIDDVEDAVDFYTTHFGFTIRSNFAPGSPTSSSATCASFSAARRARPGGSSGSRSRTSGTTRTSLRRACAGDRRRARSRGTRRARQQLGLTGVLRSDLVELSAHRGGHDRPTLDEYSNLSSYERRVAQAGRVAE
jgi:hypothetical protein